MFPCKYPRICQSFLKITHSSCVINNLHREHKYVIFLSLPYKLYFVNNISDHLIKVVILGFSLLLISKDNDT